MKYLHLAAILSIAPSETAQAADEEIQAYMGEMNPSSGCGLDIHLKHGPDRCDRNVDYAGQESSQGRSRITLGLSNGLTSEIELGVHNPSPVPCSGSLLAGHLTVPMTEFL